MFQAVGRQGVWERVVETPVYNLALGAGEEDFERVAAAEARTAVPRSFVLAAAGGNKSGQMPSISKRKQH